MTRCAKPITCEFQRPFRATLQPPFIKSQFMLAGVGFALAVGVMWGLVFDRLLRKDCLLSYSERLFFCRETRMRSVKPICATRTVATLRTTAVLAVIAVPLWLTGCGGGNQSTGSSVSNATGVAVATTAKALDQTPPVVFDARVDASLCNTNGAPTASPDGSSTALMDGQCMRTSPLLLAPPNVVKVTTQQARTAGAPSTRATTLATGTITSTAVFDWAEATFAGIFVGHKTNQTAGALVYRFYPESQTYIAVNDDKVYVLGPATNNAVALVGRLADFNCLVFPGNCTVPDSPVIGTATAGDGLGVIAFSGASSGSGASVSFYTATCIAVGSSKSASATASPITVSGLTNDTLYSCQVSATNNAGTSNASGVVTVKPVASSTPITPGATAPGAPTIGAATAGNASASIAFTAPASNGGATITLYTATCTAAGVSKTGSTTASPASVTGLTNSTVYSCSVTATNSVGTGAASGSVSVTPVASTSSGTASTASVLCSYSASVLNTFLNLTSTSAISCSGTQRTITGNGIPDHTLGAFPSSGNPNTISLQNVRFTNTTAPAVVSSTGTAVAHTLGYANNAIKFDPATAESYQNAGVWNIEALNQTYFSAGADSSNAHVQPNGAYHYHGIPEGYVTRLAKGTGMALVGFAVDGFPMYARYGYNTATDANSGTKAMTPSWRKKTTPSAGRPSTSIAAMGTFTQDFEYVAGLGDLDECNGRFGVTPEFPNGIYHYYITDAFPYIQRCVKGTAASTGP
mgnify:FL=1